MNIKVHNLTKKFSIDAEVADSFLKHAKGLSFSKKKNMLFIMPLKRKWKFWMFGMQYPLKIIYINEDKRIFEVQYAEPLTFDVRTWKIYKPKQPCRYVLEVSEKYKFAVGDKLDW